MRPLLKVVFLGIIYHMAVWVFFFAETVNGHILINANCMIVEISQFLVTRGTRLSQIFVTFDIVDLVQVFSKVGLVNIYVCKIELCSILEYFFLQFTIWMIPKVVKNLLTSIATISNHFMPFVPFFCQFN